ncbi:hypothetical protein J1614_000088 [Plenodomus biglobosus]|nr:hypothetical protein J1614_000088 [Plenodomus biglobosus]
MAAEQKRLDPNPGPGAYKKHIPFQYTIAFGNPTTAGVRYCSNALIANPCISDANQLEGPNNVQSPNPGKWTPRSLAQSVTMPEFNHYISRRGDVISMPQNVEPGHVLWRPEIIPSVKAKARATTDEEELQALYEDPESYILIEDEISHWVSPEHVRSLSNKAS